MVTRPLIAAALTATAVVTAGCMPYYGGSPTAPSAVAPSAVACTGPPGPVSFLGWTTAAVPPGSVTLTWDHASGVVTAYIVELGTTRGAANLGTVEVSFAATAHTFDRLAPGDYFARVR